MLLTSIALAALPAVSQPEPVLPTPEPALPAWALEFAPATPAWMQLEEPAKGFDFSYTFVQLGFGFVDVDDFDDESETLTGRASLGLFDVFYLFLDYQNSSTDFNDTDTDMFGLGAGVHFDAGDRLDFVGEASWLTADVESNLATLDDSNDGWQAFAGARYLLLPVGNGGLEANGGFRMIDIAGVYSDDEVTAWELGARYHFGRLISLGGVYQFLEDDGFYGVDARLSF